MLLNAPEADRKRSTFFDAVFNDVDGYVFLSFLDSAKNFSEKAYKLPEQRASFYSDINPKVGNYNVYFCPQVFETEKRTKESVKYTPCAWADLDSCSPEKMLLAPTFVLESSPGRYQALWLFAEEVTPVDAEEISKRIAYYHANDGADKSGWDLSQLLRVPFTHNLKYGGAASRPQVLITSANSVSYHKADFEVYPKTGELSASDIPYPEVIPKPEDILEKFRMKLQPAAIVLFQTEPQDDWSRALWQLQMMCYEAGMDREEVFAIAADSACNKYERDGRPASALWKEVCKSWIQFEERQHGTIGHKKADETLLSDQERRDAESITSVVEEYVEWAKTIGDAAWAYHEAGAFVALSTLLAGAVKLPTSFGTVVPNLWFMILADTTLTRKTTAMDIAMDMIAEIDSDAVMATDGSIEGLFTSMSTRPGRSSVFLRDEFSGLLEAMIKKDYMAGMMETLTKLYDGKYQKRLLKKDVIEVRDPILILFAGGIKTRVQAQLTYEHVGSGFLPRFLFVSADSDPTRLRPLGPPTEQSMGRRGAILTRFQTISSYYQQSQLININGRQIASPRRWEASLTPEAWVRYNKFEHDMVTFGVSSTQADILVPTFDRMSKSALKMSVLLAAQRALGDHVTVEESDLIKAITYIEKWRPYTLDVVTNLGKTAAERSIELILGAIKRQPGVLKSHVMRAYHLDARTVEMVLSTLDQRQMISRIKSGRTEKLYPMGG